MLKRLPKKIQPLWGRAALGLALGLVSCSSSPQSSPPITQSLPKVVATTGVLCDLTRQIAHNTIDLTCLVKPGQDPHTYQPQPEDRKAIETANLIFYGGYGHEPTLLKLIAATKNQAAKVAVHEKAVPKPLMGPEDNHEGEEKPSAGELVPDPHVWHNTQNGIRMVAVISSELQKLAPSRGALYTRNAQQLTSNLQQLHRWIETQLATLPPGKRQLVTTHDALNYYAQAYGLKMVGALQGITTNEQPTPKRIAELASEIKSTGVPTIFAETTVNPKLMQAVAREAHVKISEQELYSDGLGPPRSGADTYQGMLIANTCAIAQGLGSHCTPFVGQVSP